MTLQRAAGNSAVAGVLAQSGNPLEPDVRADMESRFGHDFGDVRVHTDAGADHSARAINANAYTAGTHVVFQRDAYAPHTDAGRHTLAHELTHVLQQKAGPVDGTPIAEGFTLSHPDDRFEREAAKTADRITALQHSASNNQEEERLMGNSPSVARRGDFAPRDERRPTPAFHASRVSPPFSAGNKAIAGLIASSISLQRQDRSIPGQTRVLHPIHFRRPLPTRSTGIEGTYKQGPLDYLNRQIVALIAAWRNYRHTFNGPVPGGYAAEVAQAQGPDILSDNNAHRYLAGAIGREDPDGLYLLREWVAMARANMRSAPRDASIEAIRELYNLSTISLHHEYTISGGGLTPGGGPARIPRLQPKFPFGPSGTFARVRVNYRNNIGISYSTSFRLVGVGAAVNLRLSGDIQGHARSSRLWIPHEYGEWWLGRLALPYYTLVNELRFTDHGGLYFRLRTGLYDGGAGARWLGGTTVGRGRATAHADPVPPQVVLRGPNLNRLIDAHLFFDTESAEISVDGNQTLRWIVRSVASFLRTYDDAHLRVRILAHASPRWQGAGNSAEAFAHNLELSARRGQVVRDQLENAVRAHAGGNRCDFTIEDCPPTPEPQGDTPQTIATGSHQATSLGVPLTADPWLHRRVDIAIDRSAYGYNPERAQPRPGEQPDPRAREGLAADVDLSGITNSTQ